MFQPQSTPYAYFATYGLSNHANDYYSQAAPRLDGLPNDHSGPTARSRRHGAGGRRGGGGSVGSGSGGGTSGLGGGRGAGTPTAPGALGAAPLNIFTSPPFNHPDGGILSAPYSNNSTTYSARSALNLKMASDSPAYDDLAAQEAAARDYQPQLEVSCPAHNRCPTLDPARAAESSGSDPFAPLLRMGSSSNFPTSAISPKLRIMRQADWTPDFCDIYRAH